MTNNSLATEQETAPPPLEPAEVDSPHLVFPAGRRVTALEQYLVVVIDGERVRSCGLAD